MTRFDVIYQESRLRIAGLVIELTAQQLRRTVPACPRWTVHETVAHLAGVAHDFATGRLDGKPGPAWTARHVAERRECTLHDNLAEWARWSPDIAPLLRGADAQITLAHDITQHEADIRAAVKAAPLPDHVWKTMLDHLARTAESWAAMPGTLVLRANGRTWWIGRGDPSALAETDGYALWRAFFGRRSVAQMRAWRWTGPADPFIARLPVFLPRTDDLTETAHEVPSATRSLEET